MHVYLVPIGAGRFAPYFEHGDEPADASGPGTGFIARMRARFAEVLREAEHERHHVRLDPPTGVVARLQRRMTRWIAERVAEQRLLWRLRTAAAATLHVPDDVAAATAERIFQDGLKKDGDRHLWRTGLHALGLLASLPLVVVPGPNMVGYFFTFTVVSHFLSYRGARRGQTAVRWTVTPSPELADLGRALSGPRADRHDQIHGVAERLRLQRLATFVERIVAPTA
jgi:hypothetical protein